MQAFFDIYARIDGHWQLHGRRVDGDPVAALAAARDLLSGAAVDAVRVVRTVVQGDGVHSSVLLQQSAAESGQRRRGAGAAAAISRAVDAGPGDLTPPDRVEELARGDAGLQARIASYNAVLAHDAPARTGRRLLVATGFLVPVTAATGALAQHPDLMAETLKAVLLDANVLGGLAVGLAGCAGLTWLFVTNRRLRAVRPAGAVVQPSKRTLAPAEDSMPAAPDHRHTGDDGVSASAGTGRSDATITGPDADAWPGCPDAAASVVPAVDHRATDWTVATVTPSVLPDRRLPAPPVPVPVIADGPAIGDTAPDDLAGTDPAGIEALPWQLAPAPQPDQDAVMLSPGAEAGALPTGIANPVTKTNLAKTNLAGADRINHRRSGHPARLLPERPARFEMVPADAFIPPAPCSPTDGSALADGDDLDRVPADVLHGDGRRTGGVIDPAITDALMSLVGRTEADLTGAAAPKADLPPPLLQVISGGGALRQDRIDADPPAAVAIADDAGAATDAFPAAVLPDPTSVGDIDRAAVDACLSTEPPGPSPLSGPAAAAVIAPAPAADADDTGADDTGADDTGADDAVDPAPDMPPLSLMLPRRDGDRATRTVMQFLEGALDHATRAGVIGGRAGFDSESRRGCALFFAGALSTSLQQRTIGPMRGRAILDRGLAVLIGGSEEAQLFAETLEASLADPRARALHRAGVDAMTRWMDDRRPVRGDAFDGLIRGLAAWRRPDPASGAMIVGLCTVAVPASAGRLTPPSPHRALAAAMLHDDLVRAAIRDHQGRSASRGKGMIFSTFKTPAAGLAAALSILRGIAGHHAGQPDAVPWGAAAIGVATVPQGRDPDGIRVRLRDEIATLCADAQPGEILASRALSRAAHYDGYDFDTVDVPPPAPGAAPKSRRYRLIQPGDAATSHAAE